MTVDELTDFFGSNKKTADFFGVTPEAISMWGKRKGRLIPKGRAIEADHGTNGALKYNPSLYQKSVTEEKTNVINQTVKPQKGEKHCG